MPTFLSSLYLLKFVNKLYVSVGVHNPEGLAEFHLASLIVDETMPSEIK